MPLFKSSLFLADYREVVTNLAGVNPDAADRFCDAVEGALDLLTRHHEAGRLAGFAHCAGRAAMGRLRVPQLHPVLSSPARWRAHRPFIARGARFAAAISEELKHTPEPTEGHTSQ